MNKNYEWMVTPEKCGDVWKVAVQTTNGDVHMSTDTYKTKDEAFKVAMTIYTNGEFISNKFEYDFINK